MRIVAGLVPATGGRDRHRRRAVAGPETRLGIVFQSPVLLDWRTALGNVLLQVSSAASIRSRTRRGRARCSPLSLDRSEDHRPRELSGGMRQRCAIVRALIHDPAPADGRAVRRARRPDARADARGPRGAVAPDPQDRRVHHPQHRRGGAARRPRPRDVAASRPRRAHRRDPAPAAARADARKAPEFVAAAETITQIFSSAGVHAAHGGLSAKLRPSAPGDGETR